MINTPNNSKIKPQSKIRHQIEYRDFIEWIATPTSARNPKTQQELSKKFGVGQDTLSEWKHRQDFWTEVARKRKEWGREKAPDIVKALYDRIIKTGGAAEVKLWLEYFEGWSEKTIETQGRTKRKYEHLSNAELMELRRALIAKIKNKQ
jgi:hypothetical protein